MRAPTSRAARAGAAALSLLLGACATMGGVMGGYHDAHRGAGGGDGWLRPWLERGSYDSALVRLTSGRDAPSDPLLRALYAGAVAHYGGRYAMSARSLSDADVLAENRYTKSVSRGGLSLLTSDLVLPYTPGRTERLLVHYYGVLGYLKQDSVVAAAVEARRLSKLLERFAEGRSADEAATHAMLHYVAGVAFDAAGERTDALVAYRNAAALGGDPAPAAAVERAPTARRSRGATVPRSTPPAGEVVVVLEQGFIGHRAEESGTVGFDSSDVVRLASGHADTSVAALIKRRFAPKQAARSRAPIAAATSRGTYSTTAQGGGAISAIRHAARGGDGMAAAEPAPFPRPVDADPSAPVRPETMDDTRPLGYLLRIAWPTFVHGAQAPALLGVTAVGDSRAPTLLRYRADLSDAAARDFERQRTALLARAAGRAAAKYWATRAAKRKGGALGGAVANAATALLERADTRSWHLLPGTISVARLTLPAGVHHLMVELPGAGGAPVRVPVGAVTVSAGRVSVVSKRLWSRDQHLAPRATTASGVI